MKPSDAAILGSAKKEITLDAATLPWTAACSDSCKGCGLSVPADEKLVFSLLWVVYKNSTITVGEYNL